MINDNTFDVIIVGGSYAGLAASMALGRALKRVLTIDDGKPCNRQTPYSHNFLTNDGRSPAEIASLANLQVRAYETVKFFSGTAIRGKKTKTGFEIEVSSGEIFTARKLIFATGIKDILPDIEGVKECWGISVLHCPFCHGYEVRNRPTGIIGNGDAGVDFTMLISNWTKELTLYTNGTSTLTNAQRNKLEAYPITIVEKEIAAIEHDDGYIRNVVFKDGERSFVEVIYAPCPFVQNCNIPESLGCELTEEGYIKINNFHETTFEGVFAIGDNAARMRTVANAVAMGTSAGMTISRNMILEEFAL